MADPEEVRRAVLAFRETAAAMLDQLLAVVDDKASSPPDGGDGGIEKIEIK